MGRSWTYPYFRVQEIGPAGSGDRKSFCVVPCDCVDLGLTLGRGLGEDEGKEEDMATEKVRIAVVLDSEGNWAAAGLSGASDESQVDFASEVCENREEGSTASSEDNGAPS